MVTSYRTVKFKRIRLEFFLLRDFLQPSQYAGRCNGFMGGMLVKPLHCIDYRQKKIKKYT